MSALLLRGRQEWEEPDLKSTGLSSWCGRPLVNSNHGKQTGQIRLAVPGLGEGNEL